MGSFIKKRSEGSLRGRAPLFIEIRFTLTDKYPTDLHDESFYLI
jgi:hypothetical protein